MLGFPLASWSRDPARDGQSNFGQVGLSWLASVALHYMLGWRQHRVLVSPTGVGRAGGGNLGQV